MRTHDNSFSVSLKHLAFGALLAVSTATGSAAQTPAGPAAELEALLTPGITAWITDARGREEKARIVTASDGLVTMAVGGEVRRVAMSDVTRVRTRQSDSLIDGALIGAGAAIAAGLFLCTRSEPWRNCRDDVGPMVRIGAIGAGVGIGIDALIRGRRTIYEAGHLSTHLFVAPIVSDHARGLRVSLTF